MKQFWLAIILIFTLTISVAQNNKRFRHLDIDRGLVHTDATVVTEDEQGFIWIGTNAGVQRFDGQQTKLFFNTTSKQNQVYNNRITTLYSEGKYLWVGSEGGLHLFNLENEKHIPLTYIGQDFNASPQLVSRVIGLNGFLWLVCSGRLYRATFNEENRELEIIPITKLVRTPEAFATSQKISLETNNSDILWVGTSTGIASLKSNGENVEFLEFSGGHKKDLGLVQNRMNHIRFYKNQLWLVTPNYLQVYSLENNSFKLRSLLKTICLDDVFKGTESEFVNRSLNDFLVDGENNFWCATSAGLVFINEPLSQNPQFQRFTYSQYNPFSISSNNVSHVLLDHSNCLWASTWAGGLSFLDLEQKQFNLLVKDPSRKGYSLSDPFVRAITQDNNGRVWVAGQNEGIDFYEPETGRCHPFRIGSITNKSLTSTRVRSLKFYKNKVYVGTTNGLDIIDLTTQKIYNYPELFGAANPIYSMDFDQYENLWVGTWRGGLFQVKLDKNRPVKIVEINENKNNRLSLSSNQVNYVFVDKTKNEVLVSTKKGLNRLLLGDYGWINNIIYYRSNETETSFSSEYVWPIQKESDTVYWVGTLGGGLNRFVLLDGWDDNNCGNYKATSFAVEQGAPANDIESLLTDDKGNLWLGSKGLSVFNPKTTEFWNFDVNDGLQSNGFKIGSAYKNKEGILFFGGINGMNYFDPKNIKRNEIRTKIVLNGLHIRNSKITPGQEINKRVLLQAGLSFTSKLNLNYKENDFSLSFASLHYANPEKCRYKYVLEGYDNEWHSISGDYPIANYSNLDYGDYTFKVDATNGDGLWSGKPAELKIQISPPWWFSGWAYFAYFLLFVAVSGGVLFYILRWMQLRNELKLVEAEEQKKEELHQMKLQFFMNISHEFKTPLTLIQTPIEKLKSGELKSDERNKMLHLLSENANRLLKLVNELMDFRKAEVGRLALHAVKADLKEFSQKVYQQFVPLCQKSSIDYSYSFENVPEIWFDPEKMSTILYNLLANAINYTDDGGSVRLKVFQAKRKDIKMFFPHSIVVGEKNSNSSYVYVQVVDTGVGISKKSISQIFDRFYHLGTSKTKHLGTGIGLALLKNLVLLHHGHVIVSSERNKGTEFLVGFPIGDNHLQAHEKGQEIADDMQMELEDIAVKSFVPAPDLANNALEDLKTLPTLLLVEDNNELRDVLHDHFAHNYKVIEAENGKDALDKIEDKTIDLVVSDIMMPVMDGLELLKVLREDIKTSHLPIALLTAKSTLEDQIAGTEAGADLYFPKPFNLKLMDLKIKQFIESRNKLRESYSSNVFAESRELARTQKDKDFLERFMELVDENIDNNDFTIDSICREMSIGRTNLYKKIRSLTGQSMGEFIRGLRLKKAAKILITEDVSISEVLYRVGINSNSYFTKSFKAQFGMTPTEFMQQNVGRYN